MSIVANAYFRVFEPYLAFGEATRRKTTDALRAARLRMLPEFYLTLSYIAGVAVGLAGLVVSGVVLVLAPNIPGALAAVLMIAIGGALFAATRLGFAVYPIMVASSRGRSIDAEFPSAVTLCYALARGGVGATEIFRTIASEKPTYGEISVEFAQVVREIDLAGKDLNSALQSVATTTPSATLRAFLEGLVTMLNSGADVKDYFRRQATTQLSEASMRVDKEIEAAGLLAESYVSGLLVLPLLLLVVLTILSVLSSGGGGAFVPIIVFVMIPGGTFAYLVLTETMMPAGEITVPRAASETLTDYGVSTLPRALLVLPPPRDPTVSDIADDLSHEGMEAKQLRRRLVFEWAQRRAGAAWGRFAKRAIVAPMEALQMSGLLALVVVMLGAGLIYLIAPTGTDITVGWTTLALVGALAALLPVAIFHEIRVQRARRVDGAMPEVLGRLAGFNEKGVSLLKSFQILGRSAPPTLRKDLRALDRDVTWTGNLRAALRRFRERVNTRRMSKLGILFERGVAATGNLKDVLEIAASEAQVHESQQARKRQAMMSYVVVVYVVFLVFLYVIYMVTDLFYGADSGFTALAAGKNVGGLGGGLEAGKAKLLFFHAVLIQGVACGLVAGKLGESYLLSGIKHSAVLAAIAWVVFRFTILA